MQIVEHVKQVNKEQQIATFRDTFTFLSSTVVEINELLGSPGLQPPSFCPTQFCSLLADCSEKCTRHVPIQNEIYIYLLSNLYFTLIGLD